MKRKLNKAELSLGENLAKIHADFLKQYTDIKNVLYPCVSDEDALEMCSIEAEANIEGFSEFYFEFLMGHVKSGVFTER